MGQSHPLLDQLYGKMLWSDGNRDRAIRFVKAKARLWSKSFLFSLLSSMYELSGDRRLAYKNLVIADYLAREELKGKEKL